MRVRTITWDRVTIKYPYERDNFIFRNATVDMRLIEGQGDVYAITIRESSIHDPHPPSHVYGKPRILELTSFSFVAEAYGFSNTKLDDYPVTIIGEFDFDESATLYSSH